jgi:Protein of unknown function (DUF2511)
VFELKTWIISSYVVGIFSCFIVSSASPFAQKIKKSDFGDKWPFTVNEGVLDCIGTNGFGEVIFTAKGVTYAVNGIASGTKKYKELKLIWKDEPRKDFGPKKDIGPIIQAGLKLCK